MTNDPCISVIVPVYSGLEELDRCLQSLLHNELGHQSEIIVIDDCSPEASEAVGQVVQKYHAKYYRRAANAGPGVARNWGAELARGDILAFIDSDCVAPSDWLSRLTQPIREGNCSATTSCYCGPVSPSWITTFQNEDYLYRMPSTECDTYFVNSCNMAVKRDVFLECNGFPVQRVSEDMVLGIVLAENGTPARYLPEAGVQHNYYRTLIGYLKQRFSFAFNTIRSYVLNDDLRSSQVPSKVRSFNPTRTVLGMFFNLAALASFILAGIAAVYDPDLVTAFLLSGIISLVLETLVHAFFVLFLIKRQGLGRTVSYIFLLYMIDLAYILGVLKGLTLGLHRALRATTQSPIANGG